MPKKTEMRNNNKQLDEVCLDCLDNIDPKTKVLCKNCAIPILKKKNNQILAEEG